MELFYQACEVAATGSEVVMMLYFVSKFQLSLIFIV